MSVICLDFETRSDMSLKKHGRTRYFAGKDADIICMAYKIDDQLTELWTPGTDLPDFVINAYLHQFYAFNAQFDLAVWNTLGPKYKFPLVQTSCWIDVMAICGRFTYHQSLEQAGEDLELKVKKNPRGKALIKKICSPPYEYTHVDLMEFHEYCRDDVNSTYEMLGALPASKLSSDEQEIWKLTVKINNHGLPVDVEAAKAIYKLTEIYKEDMNELLPSLTDGIITKATQAIRITKWLVQQGVKTANLTAGTVEKLLKRVDLTDKVRTVLQLRQELGKSSTAKYLKIIEQAHNYRIYDNLRYYAANTGRWGGLGFQLHNLPRSKVKDAQPIIDQFMNYEIIEKDPVNAAKSIIRGMICAPSNKMLCFVDYAGIENRGLAWVADDKETLQLFRDGLDQYIDMASFLFNKAYDEITDEERYEGKQLVLGCGYGLGWAGYAKRAECEDEVAMRGVGAWRRKYYKVVNLWYTCKKCASMALNNPGIEFTKATVRDTLTGIDIVVDTNCKFKVIRDRNKTSWLQMTIPSGRNLYYNTPEFRDGKFGPEVTAMGINPYSKKWQRLSIIPGRFVENVIQALSRDILAQGKLNLDKAGYKIIGSIHDEVILEVSEGTDCLGDVNNLMCDMPEWAEGLPLATEGVIEKRYRKM
jgi:DNA polymerase